MYIRNEFSYSGEDNKENTFANMASNLSLDIIVNEFLLTYSNWFVDYDHREDKENICIHAEGYALENDKYYGRFSFSLTLLPR